MSGALLIGGAPPAAAQTFEEALAAAYNTNPQLMAERANQRATDEQIAQARSGWRPTVTVNGSIGKGYTDIKGLPNYPVVGTPKQGPGQRPPSRSIAARPSRASRRRAMRSRPSAPACSRPSRPCC
ncbi:MAG: TolC family protein [Pseudomonadota bacterium]